MLTLLLPPLPRLLRSAEGSSHLARLLGRADRLPNLPESRSGQFEILFDVEPRPLAVASLTRAMEPDVGEAGIWLRADPAHVLVDIAAVRLMACGDLGLESEEVRQHGEHDGLGDSLAAMFAEEGLRFEAPSTSRWYLKLPQHFELPQFHPPESALGTDMEAWLPQGADQHRWRRLLNQAQMVLHEHPVNSARIMRGQLTVNSLWFWGVGHLPAQVRGDFSRIVGEDPLLRALAARAGVEGVATCSPEEGADALVDLAQQPTQPDLNAWLQKAADGAELVFAGGERFRLATWQRLRFWRSGFAETELGE